MTLKLSDPKPRKEPLRIPVHTPVTRDNPRSGILIAFGAVAVCAVLVTLVLVALVHYISTVLQNAAR